MPQSLNVFTGGVDRDSSESAVEANRLRELRNMRITNPYKGKSGILTPVKGTSLAFEITPGFRPIGSAEHGGISFIFSVNETTGESEIGSYPSPDPAGTGGFVNDYLPLMNWYGAIDPEIDPNAPRLPMRTPLLGFHCPHQIEAVARISYDGSVNIYWTDWANPLRYVNCGFDVTTGAFVGRRYWNGSFPSQFDVFFEACPPPSVVSMVTEPGGSWRAGNLFLYFRYLKENGDPTSFLTEAGPMRMTLLDQSSAGVGTIGTAPDMNTNKRVVIDLADIDDQFKFIEVGYILYEGESFSTGLIDVRYEIIPGTTTIQIIVSGSEGVIDLPIESIVVDKDPANIVRTLATLDNRLWGGNWKERLSRKDLLFDLSQQIIARPTPASLLEEISEAASHGYPHQYQDEQNSFSKLGYFRGESYAFGIRYVLNDGQVTEAFPVTGYDAWYDELATAPNSNGVLRMPANAQLDTTTGHSYAFVRDNPGRMVSILSVSFDTSGITLDPNDPDDKWILDNVCGFYFVRAKRKPSLVYQGVVANCYSGESIDPYISYPGVPSPGTLHWSPNRIPMIIIDDDPIVPTPVMLFPQRLQMTDSSNIIFCEQVIDGDGSRVPHKFGFFSHDHFIRRSMVNGTYKAVMQGRFFISSNRYSPANARGPNRQFTGLDFIPAGAHIPLFDGADGVSGNVDTTNIMESTLSNSNGFVSAFEEGSSSSVPGSMYYVAGSSGFTELGNKDMKTRQYIGISTDGAGGTTQLNSWLSAYQSGVTYPWVRVPVVNLYAEDPANAAGALLGNVYSPKSILYSLISEFIPLADLSLMTTKKVFGGDCFVQRMFTRELSVRSNRGDYLTPNGDCYYKYGNLMSFVLECSLNVGNRHRVSNQPFFKSDSSYAEIDIASELAHLPEGRGYNEGYHEVLGPKGRLGYDAQLPAASTNYRTRIRYTREHLPSGISDQWLQWDLGAFRDYDYRNGQITRIGVVGDFLYSVQERGVNRHYVNDRATISDESGGSLVIGEGDILSGKALSLSDRYGSQHQWSLAKGLTGDFFYDQNHRAIIHIGAEGLRVTSSDGLFSRDILELSEIQSDHSDMMHLYPDASACLSGVVGWSDRKYMEVGWTFRIEGPNGMVLRTIAYSEAGVYLMDRGHHSGFYMNINEDFFSFNPTSPHSAYRHDTGSSAEFYGVKDIVSMAFVINQDPHQAKVFDNFDLVMTPYFPRNVQVRTKSQFSDWNTDVGEEHWRRPSYMESVMHFPFLQADQTFDGQDLLPQSPLRGDWAVVHLHWSDVDPIGNKEPLEVSAAKTSFRASYN